MAMGLTGLLYYCKKTYGSQRAVVRISSLSFFCKTYLFTTKSYKYIFAFQTLYLSTKLKLLKIWTWLAAFQIIFVLFHLLFVSESISQKITCFSTIFIYVFSLFPIYCYAKSLFRNPPPFSIINDNYE